jgi:hypothetical protein
MSSFTSDQGPISSISESATGESYLLHAMASTLFCENCWYFRLRASASRCGARERRVSSKRRSLKQWRGLSGVREHRFRRRLLRSWRAAWLILECARLITRSSIFSPCLRRARWSPTARVQRGASETARCTSTGRSSSPPSPTPSGARSASRRTTEAAPISFPILASSAK